MTQITGQTKWFNEAKGFGFIISEGQEYFVHANQIRSPGEKSLFPGQHVTFTPHPNPKGPQARDVTPIEADGNTL